MNFDVEMFRRGGHWIVKLQSIPEWLLKDLANECGGKIAFDEVESRPDGKSAPHAISDMHLFMASVNFPRLPATIITSPKIMLSPTDSLKLGAIAASSADNEDISYLLGLIALVYQPPK